MSFKTKTLSSLASGTTEMVAADDFDREVAVSSGESGAAIQYMVARADED